MSHRGTERSLYKERRGRCASQCCCSWSCERVARRRKSRAPVTVASPAAQAAATAPLQLARPPRAVAMSSILDLSTLYENLYNLSLSEDHEESLPRLSRRHSTSSSDYSSGDPSPVWPLRSLWSPTAEQLRPLGEPGQRPPLRPDRSVSLIEGRALPPPPPGFPPLKLPPQAPGVPSRYKTELCRTFSETGKCRYGAKCQFAHGTAELRTVSRHPKYKTELCHKFYLHGDCPYGSRCHFIHAPGEAQSRSASTGSSPQLLRQSVSYSGVPAGRRASPLLSVADPASFARAPSVSPPPASTDLFSPSFGQLASDPVSRVSTLGEPLASSAPEGCCSCRCGKSASLGSPSQASRDYFPSFSATPGTPTSSTASHLPRTASSNSLSDPECYSSSSSLSGSYSPVFDLQTPGGPVGSSHRLPIFNRFSVSESVGWKGGADQSLRQQRQQLDKGCCLLPVLTWLLLSVQAQQEAAPSSDWASPDTGSVGLSEATEKSLPSRPHNAKSPPRPFHHLPPCMACMCAALSCQNSEFAQAGLHFFRRQISNAVPHHRAQVEARLFGQDRAAGCPLRPARQAPPLLDQAPPAPRAFTALQTPEPRQAALRTGAVPRAPNQPQLGRGRPPHSTAPTPFPGLDRQSSNKRSASCAPPPPPSLGISLPLPFRLGNFASSWSQGGLSRRLLLSLVDLSAHQQQQQRGPASNQRGPRGTRALGRKNAVGRIIGSTPKPGPGEAAAAKSSLGVQRVLKEGRRLGQGWLQPRCRGGGAGRASPAGLASALQPPPSRLRNVTGVKSSGGKSSSLALSQEGPQNSWAEEALGPSGFQSQEKQIWMDVPQPVSLDTGPCCRGNISSKGRKSLWSAAAAAAAFEEGVGGSSGVCWHSAPSMEISIIQVGDDLEERPGSGAVRFQPHFVPAAVYFPGNQSIDRQHMAAYGAFLGLDVRDPGRTEARSPPAFQRTCSACPMALSVSGACDAGRRDAAAAPQTTAGPGWPLPGGPWQRRPELPPTSLQHIPFRADRSVSMIEGGGGGGGGEAKSLSSRYKTELCRTFEESGTCKYGAKCQFAHGPGELRGLSRHPKYKTEPCRTFHTSGLCPYGARCHFIHNAEERRRPLPRHAPLLHHSLSSGAHAAEALPAASHRSLRLSESFFPCDAPGRQAPLGGSLCSLCSGKAALASPGPLAFPGLLVLQKSLSADSLSDPEDSGSSGGSSSGSESPGLGPLGRRLPIFSRLSVSED
ncbi:mRNA decay activator protein ZFP36 [Hemicordylus capensis]|uniref:mRNA decay activator protein ZFP36 n=1 Tax=Hemicordylus capensis TaxID=884348 RepID=UPI002303AD8B|nr:mRNA decay activator protein ZFP36 [Hemicordylus capensis]